MDRGNIIHIHDTAQKEESIVFGHGYIISDSSILPLAAHIGSSGSLIL